MFTITPEEDFQPPKLSPSQVEALNRLHAWNKEYPSTPIYTGSDKKLDRVLDGLATLGLVELEEVKHDPSMVTFDWNQTSQGRKVLTWYKRRERKPIGQGMFWVGAVCVTDRAWERKAEGRWLVQFTRVSLCFSNPESYYFKTIKEATDFAVAVQEGRVRML